MFLYCVQDKDLMFQKYTSFTFFLLRYMDVGKSETHLLVHRRITVQNCGFMSSNLNGRTEMLLHEPVCIPFLPSVESNLQHGKRSRRYLWV
jgi:hypothetical protein